MCGICGVLYRDESEIVEEKLLRRMAEPMNHRGPDGEGYFAEGPAGLGHKRLAVIDPELGAQPMRNEDGSLVLALNGEIYNYLELRTELARRGHRFRTRADTEVLLHLYEDEGAECLPRLDGMFAFAIWDRTKRELFLARDRLGIKPLYLLERPDLVAFASEIKAFRAAGLLEPCLDEDALCEYLTFQFCLGERTFFRGARKLLPGHWLRAGRGVVRTLRWWDVDFTVDFSQEEDALAEELRGLLEDSVRLRLRSDVPPGAHLSGGFDSSTIVSIAASILDAPVHTFTGAFEEPGFDERAHARAVASHVGAVAHEIVIRPGDFVEAMPRLAHIMDEPAAGPGLFPQFFVSRLAAGEVKVVLGGQGGDELFGGYARYLVAYLEQALKGAIQGRHEEGRFVVRLDSVVSSLPLLAGYEPTLARFWAEGLFEPMDRRYFRLIDRSEGLDDVLTPDLGARVLGAGAVEARFTRFADIFNAPETQSYFNKMTHFDLQTLLPALLHVEDRTSMAASIESRTPLLDHRIVELVASIPPAIKFGGGQTKHILRRTARRLVPAHTLERRDKMGFPVPLTEWCRGPVVGPFVRESLLSKRARERGLWRTEGVERLLEADAPFDRRLWGLLNIELWFRAHVDGAA